MKLSNINLLDDSTELDEFLSTVNDTNAQYPGDKTLSDLFDEKALQFPDKVAVSYQKENLTYSQLKNASDQLGSWIQLLELDNKVVPMLVPNGLDTIIVMMGILKAGCAYLPFDPELPYERLKFMASDSGAELLITGKLFIRTANKLNWDCGGLTNILCIDSEDYDQEIEEHNELMGVEFWNHVGEMATDDISGGAWRSSYTGEDLGRNEMDEYAENIYSKLAPYLNKDLSILEVGCSTGISMFRIAPEVAEYWGTDLSTAILDWTKQEKERKGQENVRLLNLSAHEIDQIRDKKFDIVIMNSVVQCFAGHNYFKTVISKAIDLLKTHGIMFFGDIQDVELKDQLIATLKTHEEHNQSKNEITKTDWSNELFLSRGFFKDLQHDFSMVQSAKCSAKIASVENELTEFRFDAIVSIDKQMESMPEATRSRNQFDLRSIKREEKKVLQSQAQPGDIAYIIYTSGSTGTPKGVKVKHENVVRLMVNDRHYFSFSEQDVWVMAHATNFDFSVWEIYGALLYGGELVIADREIIKDTNEFLNLIKEHKVSILNQTPLAFRYLSERIIQSNDKTLSTHLKTIVFGGDKLNPTSLKGWRALYPKDQIELINMYGITETTIHVTYYEIRDSDIYGKTSINIVGKPLPETTVYVLNDQMKPVLPGALGEIYVGGTGLTAGYLNQPDITAQRFVPNPFQEGSKLYRSGDIGRWKTGNLEVTGRADNQLKIRGFRIELGEIQKALNLLVEVDEHVLVPVQENGETLLAAFIKTNQSNSETINLREELSKLLPAYAVPAYFTLVDQIPLTNNGKTDKSQLLSLLEKERLNPDQKFAEPGTTEAQIAEIWETVLKKSNIALTDNFFELGGHSLKGAQVIGRVNRLYNLQVDLKTLFSNPTVEEFSNAIAKTVSGQREPILPIPDSGDYEVSPAQRGLWITNQLNQEKNIPHITETLQFGGGLNIDSIRYAAERLAARHESLRTSFLMENGEIRQHVHLKMASKDLVKSTKFPDAGAEDIKDLLNQWVAAPLPLDGDALWKIRIIQRETDAIIWFCFHHIIFDGWSKKVFFKEFMGFYREHLIGKPFDVQPLSVQFRDYATWSNKLLRGSYLKKLEGFWSKELATGIEPLNIQTDNPRPAIKQFTCSYETVQLDAVFKKRFEAFCTQNNMSTFAGLITSLRILLSHYSSQKEVVIGTSVAGRSESVLEDQIGLFVNVLPIKLSMDTDHKVGSLLSEIRDKVMAALDHQEYPFSRIVEDLMIKKDASRHPVFDVLLVLQNFETLDNEEISKIGDVNGGVFGQDTLRSEYDLTFSFEYIFGGIQVSLIYDKALFRKERIMLMISRLELLLTCLLESEGDTITQLKNHVEQKLLGSPAQPEVSLDLNI